MATKSFNDPQDDLFVVGIGASAGGVQALQQFFSKVPKSSGIAYVVILHLSPDYDSQLTKVLRAVCPLPVSEVTGRTRVIPDHVFVISPNQHLSMSDGYITSTTNITVEDRRAPVDIFFRTLAESYGSRAVCVVLSGTGANGSMGLKRIKENDGAAFVQNPREAEYNEMPRNSIATDLVDEVLPVAEIPARIIAYKQRIGTIHIPVDVEKRPDDLQHALREIFSQLRLLTGHDFTNYKRPTLLRRIERRINIRNLPDLPAYAAFVRQHPEEIHALLKDLLISVTNFFRDRAAFEALEQQVIPAILEAKKAGSQLRIWVAGCATGEEAYSIAMICAEQLLNVTDAPKVQIFGTDIDDAAIAHAREGIYTINDAADISPERLRNFFNKDGDGYRVRREIREMVLFARIILSKTRLFPIST
jgi:two-component system CheB/CheR fusion protein